MNQIDKKIERQLIAFLVLLAILIVAPIVYYLHAHPCVRTTEFNNVGVDGVLTASGSYCAEYK